MSSRSNAAVSAPRPSSATTHRSAPGAPLLDVRELQVRYMTSRGPVRAVDGVSFGIAPGEVFGLAGESGSGKSTIAHAIMRLLHPPALITGGQVLFDGDDTLDMDDDELNAFRWGKVSMVFQSAMNALNPVITVGEQITDVIDQHLHLPKREARDRAAYLLNLVGIDRNRIDTYPHQLSGGMRQRVVIAIALALSPPLMIMDEPTTALDVVVQKEIMQQIEQLKQQMGFSILFITHDLSLMVEFSDRIGVMYAGEIVELAPAQELLRNPLHPYTQGLMNSFPSVTGPKVKLTGIPGAPPDMVEPPSGCRFHPRCPKAFDVCPKVQPRLREITPGHLVACHLY